MEIKEKTAQLTSRDPIDFNLTTYVEFVVYSWDKEFSWNTNSFLNFYSLSSMDTKIKG